MLCFVVSVVEALNNRIYYEGMSNNNKLSDLRIYLVLMIPDNKAKEPLDRVTCMRKKYPWNE